MLRFINSPQLSLPCPYSNKADIGNLAFLRTQRGPLAGTAAEYVQARLVPCESNSQQGHNTRNFLPAPTCSLQTGRIRARMLYNPNACRWRQVGFIPVSSASGFR